MNLPEKESLSVGLPISSAWEFGGHLYGLEPLALPAAWLPRGAGNDPSQATAAGPLLAPTDATALAELRPIDDSERDRLFWFRWITGHQTTFMLWQLLAATLHEGRQPDADRDRLARDARRLVRSYSLMLLYAASPPQETYERVIRDPMARQHANLSGAWARDYTDIRPLIRGKITLGGETEAALLARECELNERVHEGIAARVVPSGVSLLLTPGFRRQGIRRLKRETLLWLYDGIFLTSRVPVTYDALVGQLLRRIHAMLLDLAANGLYPGDASHPQGEPAELMTQDALALKSSFSQTLREVAKLAISPKAQTHFQFSST